MAIITRQIPLWNQLGCGGVRSGALGYGMVGYNS